MKSLTSSDSNRSAPPPWLRRLATGLIALALPCTALAQTGSGAIAGRVYNPATHEYIRNAEVRVEGTDN